MSHFFNQHWMVVGCSRRVGLFLTQQLLSQGARVTGLFREMSPALQELTETFKNQLSVHSFNLSSLENTDWDFLKTLKNSSGLDGSVHLASQFYPTSLSSLTATQWDVLFDTNVKGHVFLTQKILPYLKPFSSITHLVDIFATRPLKNYIAYSSAKGALLTFVKNLALELAPQTRVNALSPGTVLLPENYTEQQASFHLEQTLLKRLGTPEDIWKAFEFLSRNKYLTGVNLPIDGGASLI